MFRILGSIGLVGLLLLGASRAEERHGTIEGRVVDQTGAVIPGATVELWELTVGVHHTIRTDHQGSFRFERLGPGGYRILVSASRGSLLRRMTSATERA
jgi:protocatechuate 3,4-dioxygenase beta subunit